MVGRERVELRVRRLDRRVRVSDATSGETLAEYQYDGRNFRTVKCTNTSGELSEVRHFYYSSQWQVLEAARLSTLSADPGSLAPASQYVWACVTSTT